MSYNRHQPHVFQQRQRWTGRCVACGLPTEHWVHQPNLPLGIQQPAPTPEAEPEPVEHVTLEKWHEIHSPQLQLF